MSADFTGRRGFGLSARSTRRTRLPCLRIHFSASCKNGLCATSGKAPLKELSDIFNRIDAPVVIGCLPDIKHEHVLARGNAYMTAWMRHWLCGDTLAARCFVGPGAEMLRNKEWQDVNQKGL